MKLFTCTICGKDYPTSSQGIDDRCVWCLDDTESDPIVDIIQRLQVVYDESTLGDIPQIIEDLINLLP